MDALVAFFPNTTWADEPPTTLKSTKVSNRIPMVVGISSSNRLAAYRNIMSSLNSLSQGISNSGRIAGVEARENARPAVGSGPGRIVGTVDEKVVK